MVFLEIIFKISKFFLDIVVIKYYIKFKIDKKRLWILEYVIMKYVRRIF